MIFLKQFLLKIKLQKIYSHYVVFTMIVITIIIFGVYYVTYFKNLRLQHHELNEVINKNTSELKLKESNLKNIEKHLIMIDELKEDSSMKKIGTSADTYSMIINVGKIMEVSGLTEDKFKIIKNGTIESEFFNRALNETIINVSGYGEIKAIKSFIDNINESEYFYKVDYVNISYDEQLSKYFISSTLTVYN